MARFEMNPQAVVTGLTRAGAVEAWVAGIAGAA